jgi:hypothetical protein
MSRFEDLFPGGQSIHQEGLAIINFTEYMGVGTHQPPAVVAISANSRTVMGASLQKMDAGQQVDGKNADTSDGFTMTLFPAARAGAIFLIAMSKGWLKGYLSNFR